MQLPRNFPNQQQSKFFRWFTRKAVRYNKVFGRTSLQLLSCFQRNQTHSRHWEFANQFSCGYVSWLCGRRKCVCSSHSSTRPRSYSKKGRAGTWGHGESNGILCIWFLAYYGNLCGFDHFSGTVDLVLCKYASFYNWKDSCWNDGEMCGVHMHGLLVSNAINDGDDNRPLI